MSPAASAPRLDRLRHWFASQHDLATEACELRLAAGDASFRRYYRATLPDGRSGIDIGIKGERIVETRPKLQASAELEIDAGGHHLLCRGRRRQYQPQFGVQAIHDGAGRAGRHGKAPPPCRRSRRVGTR